VFASLAKTALDSEQSRSLIEAIAVEFYVDGADDDGLAEEQPQR
jgi:hypothetical protein